MSKTIGVIGTRRRDTKEDFEKTRKLFYQIYKPNDKICSGLCPKGGDWFAVLIALGLDWVEDENYRSRLYSQILSNDLYPFSYEIQPIWYPANWNQYGKNAGFIRNIDIADTSDILIACVSEDRIGGTEDTIKKYIGIHWDNYKVYYV